MNSSVSKSHGIQSAGLTGDPPFRIQTPPRYTAPTLTRALTLLPAAARSSLPATWAWPLPATRFTETLAMGSAVIFAMLSSTADAFWLCSHWPFSPIHICRPCSLGDLTFSGFPPTSVTLPRPLSLLAWLPLPGLSYQAALLFLSSFTPLHGCRCCG